MSAPVPNGTDLAARARFVAMTFSAPHTGAGLPGPPIMASRHIPLPLDIACQPTRFSLTLGHAALRYRLRLGNRGAGAAGPLLIHADLAAVEPGIPADRQAEFDAYGLPLCHYLDDLPAGGHAELTGELRLSLAGIAAIRLGAAELLVPLLRICVESAGHSRPAPSLSACFAIGLQPAATATGLQPLHLNSAHGIWRNLTARQLAGADLR